jgi:branched-chain amino acid transport system permease protein
VTAEAARTMHEARFPEWMRSQTFVACVVLTTALLFFRVVWDIPDGILIQGAIFGGLSSLIALGLALVWRANRVINFAAGDLGAVPVAFAAALALGTFGFNWWVAGAVGVLAALALGFLVETLLVRRFFRSPRLILTVATIGIAQVLTGLALFIPRWFDLARAPGSRIPQPFDVTIEIAPVIFGGGYITAAITIPLVFVALGAFMRFSRIGIAIRASAQRADRAVSLGIPIHRINTTVWILAALLSFVALYLRASVVGVPIGQVLGPAILLRALAAAVIGRMDHMPTIAIAGIGIGVLEQSVVWHWGRTAYVDPVLFLVVMAALFLVPGGSGRRVDDDTVSTWRATREIRPIPRELRKLPEVRYGRWALGAVIALFVVTLPLWLGAGELHLASLIVLFAIVAVSLVVLTGWAGQVSLGQMGFVGIGAAVGGAVTDRLGWDLAFAMITAGIVGAVVAMVVGLPALRRRGLTLAVMTLAFALMVSSYLLNRTFFGEVSDRNWLPGRRVERVPILGGIDVTTETQFFFLALVALGIAILMVQGVRNSRTGRALIAIRENERAAEAFGVHARRTTLVAFAFSGFLAAFAGSLFVHHQGALSPSAFAPEQSLQVFAMVVIGGLGSVPGAILGAVYVRGAQWYLPIQWQFLATGAGLLLVLLVLRGGLGGALADLRDMALRFIARRRGIVVPSLLADVRVEEPEPTPTFENAHEIVEENAGNAMPEHAP